MIRTAVIFLLLLTGAAAEAQLVEYPLPRKSASTKPSRQSARTQAVDATYVPFFDDFSSSDATLRDTLWLYGQSVLLNNGVGLRPPSKNVVTFDGVDSLGKPYILNDVLAKGYADQLMSQPIRMDLVPVVDRPTVYFSFFYQREGLGELPDPGDDLTLAFKADDGTWEIVYALEATDPALADTTFEQIIIPVTDARFFHDGFQFRFYNYARLTGRYDTWNLDYIYLNRFRDPNDIYYPDRTISSSLTSLFNGYFSMPLHHFLTDKFENLAHPSVKLYNMKPLDTNFDYSSVVTISTSRQDSTYLPETFLLDNLRDPGDIFLGLQFYNLSLFTLPDTAKLYSDADSIHLRLKLSISTGDNVPIGFPGDYDPVKYSPVDFRHSDTTTVNYTLSSYYAYDDGTAEYFASTNQAGAFFAYQFTPVIAVPDTLTYVDIYFPEFGDNTSQSIILQVRSQLGDINAPPLHEELIVVNRTTQDRFTRYFLYQPVLVGTTFYIGWKQLTQTSIPIGLDKNTDNANKMYYNTTGNWVQNVDVKGSLMFRPGFRLGSGIVSGTEPAAREAIAFPNPAPGFCRLNFIADQVAAFDITGRPVELQWEHEGTYTRVQFASPVSGLVILRAIGDGQLYTMKVMVQAAERP